MIPWIEILTILASLFKDCFAKGRTDEQVRAEIRKPGLLAQMKFETDIRKKLGVTKLKDWRDQRAAIMDPIYRDMADASDTDVDMVLSQAKEIDWTA